MHHPRRRAALNDGCPYCGRPFPCLRHGTSAIPIESKDTSPMISTRARAVTAAVVATAALVLAGCSLSDEVRPVGTVVELELDEECTGKGATKRCHDEYDITVRTGGGDEVDVEDVPEDHIKACPLKARYPDCARAAR